MRNFILTLMALWIGSIASGVDAGWLTATRRELYRSHQRSQCWPYPYNLMDQQAVREPFRLMVERGWQAQNRIGTEHFEAGSDKLNAHGRRHVQWVLSRKPETRRILFVEPGQSARQTARRLATVERMARLSEDDTGVEVVLTTVTQEPSARAVIHEKTSRRAW